MPADPCEPGIGTTTHATLTPSKKGSFRPDGQLRTEALVVAIIGKNPERYGFTGIEKQVQ